MKKTIVLFAILACALFPAFLSGQQYMLKQNKRCENTYSLFEEKKSEKPVGDINIGITLKTDNAQHVIILDFSLREKLKKENAYVYLFDIEGERKEIFASMSKEDKIIINPEAPDNIKRLYETPENNYVLNLALPFSNHLFKFNTVSPPVELNLNSAAIGPKERITLVLNLYYGKEKEFCGAYKTITVYLQMPEEEKPAEQEAVSQPTGQDNVEVVSQPLESKESLKDASSSDSPAPTGGGGVVMSPGQEAAINQLFEDCKMKYFELFELRSNSEVGTINPGMLTQYRAGINELKNNYEQQMKGLVITDFRKKRQFDEFYDYYNGAGSIIDELEGKHADEIKIAGNAVVPEEVKPATGNSNLKYLLIVLGALVIFIITAVLILKWKKKTPGGGFKPKNRPPSGPNMPVPPKPPQPRPNNIKI